VHLLLGSVQLRHCVYVQLDVTKLYFHVIYPFGTSMFGSTLRQMAGDKDRNGEDVTKKVDAWYRE